MTHPAIALPKLIAHRGYSAVAPENTLTAVRAAHQAGATWVELDVQLLGDGTPVIWHDIDVNRCSDGRGLLATTTWSQAQRFDVGSWFGDAFTGEKMATLDAMLELLNTLEMGVNLEIKVNKGRDPIALVDRILPLLLGSFPAERLIVSSFNAAALSRCRHYANKEALALGVLFGSTPKNWREQCAAIEAFSVHAHWPRLKRSHAAAMKHDKYQILCYTPNDPSAFESRWTWGVTSAITDDPVTFQRFLKSRPSSTLN